MNAPTGTIHRRRRSVVFLVNLFCLVIFFNTRSAKHGEAVATQKIGGTCFLIDDLVLYLLDSCQRGGMCWIRDVQDPIVVRDAAANIPVMCIDHHQSRLTQRFSMPGRAESTRDLQRWAFGVAKIELC